jgi:hypothetical protein
MVCTTVTSIGRAAKFGQVETAEKLRTAIGAEVIRLHENRRQHRVEVPAVEPRRESVGLGTRKARLRYEAERGHARCGEAEFEPPRLVFASGPGRSRFACVLRHGTHTFGENSEAPEIRAVVPARLPALTTTWSVACDSWFCSRSPDHGGILASAALVGGAE